MATKETKVQVVCFELPPFDPAKGPPQAKRMRPSPLESVTARVGRNEDKTAVRRRLQEDGHNVHLISWGHHPESGEMCMLVYIWQKGARPVTETKPAVPPARPMRTATSRRNATRPETRKKP